MNSKKTILMWSGPRNISTAMMRSFENRTDTVVTDEPFYAHYLSKTRFKHPGRKKIIESQSMDWDKIVKRLTSPIPNRAKVWYQKHMAHHNLKGCDLSWSFNLFNCFLIRDPKEVITSYSEHFPIKDHSQLGYEQQAKLFHLIRKNTGCSPPVLDAKDILVDPKKQLTKLCQLIGIDFEETMISWPTGSRESDGVWAPYWYDNVNNSSGFKAYIEKKTRILDNQKHILKKCVQPYEFLYNHKI